MPGTWRFLHQDYLQTLLEWGWIGGILWALLFFGGITVGIRSYKEHARREWTPRRRVLQPLVIIALMGVALHALVDFPVQIESIQLYVATYLGLCWGSSLWKDHGLQNDRTRHRPQHELALCYLSTPRACRSTLRYLRGPAWIGDGSCSRENTLPLLCHNHAKRNSNNSRPRDSAAIDSRPDQPGEFLTLPAR